MRASGGAMAERQLGASEGGSDLVRIRLARSDDLARINAIYNHYVPISTCTYQEELETEEGRRTWFDCRGPEHPVTVAELSGSVVGWAALSAFRTRSAYRHTVETSVYVEAELRGRRIGTALLQDLGERAQGLGHHVLVALIDSEQTASLALHTRCGFTEVGRMNAVGRKFERWLHLVIMERVCGEPDVAQGR